MDKFKHKSIAVIAVSLAAVLFGSAHAQTIPGVSDEQIRTFYASNPDNDQVQRMANSLNLTAAQLAQAMAIGRGADLNTMPASIASGYYDSARNMLGQDDGAQSVFSGGVSSFYSPTLGRGVTELEIRDFYATKPTQQQMLAKAAELGVNSAAIDRTSAFVGYMPTPEQFQVGDSRNEVSYATNNLGQVVPISDTGAMYGSDPVHGGLDTYYNGNLASGIADNPAIPNKKWVNVNGR